MIRIIPAIDIINGKVVRLSRGDFNRSKIYAQNPLDVAKHYADSGIQYLHLVDLDGAQAGHVINQRVLAEITGNTPLSVDFGGGIRSDKDIAIALDNGARQVTVGSIAVKEPLTVARWIEKYGAERFILGADVIDQKIAISAWQDKTKIDVFDFILSYLDSDLSSCICTDVSRDGLLTGPALKLYVDLKKKFPQIFLIASGGISNINDVEQLNNAGIDGVIIGKALYEDKISLEQLAELIC